MKTIKTLLFSISIIASCSGFGQDYLIVTSDGDTTEAWSVLIGFKYVEYKDVNGIPLSIEKKRVQHITTNSKTRCSD